MKKFIVAALTIPLCGIFAIAASAQPVDITACTKDGKTATLHIDVEGFTSQPGIGSTAKSVQQVVQWVFNRTANSLTAEELVSLKGLEVFQKNYADEMKTRKFNDGAFLKTPSSPTIGGPVCTVD